MGEVWRGVHREQQLPVAVKAITTDFAREAAHRRAFEREVEAIAGLEHPGIVMVLDYGSIPEEAETLSEGRLIAGSPYLVMELAQGSVQSSEVLSWPRLRSLLLAILDALAHSHARGVIHRDLKPANVLLFGDRRSVPKLADFGIAVVADRDLSTFSAGTPKYMAPEQIAGEWLDFGPWTDLYAVGCMAWRLVTGKCAFAGRNVRVAKLTGEPGEFWPATAVPRGFEAWLRRLIVRDPMVRIRRAADAAWSLLQLPIELGPDAIEPVTPASDSNDLTTRDRPYRIGGGPVTLTAAWTMDLESFSLPPDGGGELSVELPPMSETWARPTLQRSSQLFGAGLALYGLRRPHMVGRLAERDALWGALTQVVNERRARAVILRGAAGSGKSRLAQWISERAHELGAATPLKAVHSGRGGPRDGLASMAARHLKCIGLDRTEVSERLSQVLRFQHRGEIEALTELISPRRRKAGAPHVQMSAADRVEILGRLLRQLSRRRALILWLDDVQWGEEALDLAQSLLGSSDAELAPILLVLTVRDKALDVQSEAVSKLAALSVRNRVEELVIQQLESAERSELVRGLLGLADGLAEQVEQRTAGVPLFAVQLIGDWVQRGLLVLGPGGFELREGVDADLPDALHGLWADRVEHLLEGRSEDDRVALEVAGILGPHVDADEWVAVCAQLGIATPNGLIDLMVVRDLATRDEGADWAFVHGMLGESLMRVSREAGRLGAQRHACAEVLHDRGVALRRAGQLRPAVAMLERALGLVEEAILRAGIQASIGTAYREQGRLDEARAEYEAALVVHREVGDLRAESTVITSLGNVHRLQGRTELARQHYEQALAINRRRGDRRTEGVAMNNLGNIAREQGELSLANAHYEAALARAREVGSGRSEGIVLHNLGILRIMQGRWVDAGDFYEAALPLHEGAGHRRGVGILLGDQAKLLLRQGDVDAAIQKLAEAMEVIDELGDRHTRGTLMGAKALAHAQLGRVPEAREFLEEGTRLLRETDSRRELAMLLCQQGEIELSLDDPQAARRALEQAQELAAELGVSPESDVGQSLSALLGLMGSGR